MKKILIIICLITNVLIINNSYAACKLQNLGSCKADIGTNMNKNLKDKFVPNNLNNKIVPNNTINTRTNLGQPNMPSSINLTPAQEESTQPYNANCQFGNCLNNQNEGENKNK